MHSANNQEMSYEDLIDPTALGSNDIIIMIMGLTGSGKSNFIDQLTGQIGKTAGQSLKSYTAGVNAVRVKNHATYGDRIVILDTPGLNDTTKPDIEILQVLANWAKATSSSGAGILGILYLHRIIDVRMNRGCILAYQTFETLVLEAHIRNIAFVTTMWDDLLINEEEIRREKQLKDMYWNSLLVKGATYKRFQNTQDSAWMILESLLSSTDNRCLNFHQALMTRISEHRASLAHNIKVANPRKMQTKDITSDDIVIVVMGHAGAGKSTFIKLATGFNVLVAQGLSPCTQKISLIGVSVTGNSERKRIIFLDTPGLSSSYDTAAVSSWFKDLNIPIHGWLFLHRITDNRTSSTHLKNLAVFKNVVEGNRSTRPSFNKILIVTTMWQRLGKFSTGCDWENQLKTSCWKELIERGARTTRLREDNQQDALAVIAPIVDLFNHRHNLRQLSIEGQHEMAELNEQLRNKTLGFKKTLAEMEITLLKQQQLLGKIDKEIKRPKTDRVGLASLLDEYNNVDNALSVGYSQAQDWTTKIGETHGKIASSSLPNNLRDLCSS